MTHEEISAKLDVGSNVLVETETGTALGRIIGTLPVAHEFTVEITSPRATDYRRGQRLVMGFDSPQLKARR
jgi:hypothetical protein